MSAKKFLVVLAGTTLVVFVLSNLYSMKVAREELPPSCELAWEAGHWPRDCYRWVPVLEGQTGWQKSVQSYFDDRAHGRDLLNRFGLSAGDTRVARKGNASD